MKFFGTTILLLLFTIATFGQGEVKAVESLDIDRYQGKWYEIARYPNRFQKKCVSDVTADYRLLKNGQIEVTNKCLKKNGKINRAIGRAKVVDGNSSAKLKVRFAPRWLSFLPQVWGKYWILDIDDNYNVAAVGDPSRDYLWILSRTPNPKPADYDQAVKRVKSMGFDPGRLEKTSHKSPAVDAGATN